MNMNVLMSIVLGVALLLAWAVIRLKRDPMTRMGKAWEPVGAPGPGYVESISIGSLVWNDDHNRTLL
jgi:hypothetical protein